MKHAFSFCRTLRCFSFFSFFFFSVASVCWLRKSIQDYFSYRPSRFNLPWLCVLYVYSINLSIDKPFCLQCAPDLDLSVHNYADPGKPIEMVYPPGHLQHILFELFKNSMRAVVESKPENDLPDIEVSFQTLSRASHKMKLQSMILLYFSGFASKRSKRFDNQDQWPRRWNT